MQITGFEADPSHMVTIRLIELPRGARTTNTRIFIGGRPQPSPLTVEPEAQEIVFDASECREDGLIEVQVTLMGSRGAPVSARSAEEYHAAQEAPDHDGADPDYSATINSVSPKQAKPGERVKIAGKNFVLLEDVVITTGSKIPVTKAGNTATFAVPVTCQPGIYQIGFHDSNAVGVVRSNVRLEVVRTEG
ncbi:MAG TPA: hypothetical protein VHJ78_03835 [Actinomycetota bacterium]|nr:hypothetical protein [Actinomycetota bacterium]